MGLHKNKYMFKIIKYNCFAFALTFPGVAYQPQSSMTVAAAFVADEDSWLRKVGRVGRLLLPLLPRYSFTYISFLLSLMILLCLIKAIHTIHLPLYVLTKLAEKTCFSPSTCCMPVQKCTYCSLSSLLHSLSMGFCLIL